jgi:hypothetical protein
LNFQDAEKTYKDLKAQHAAGKLSDADFETEVAKLRLQDAQGRWWQIGVQTGEWYMHDGQKWNKAKPPAAPPSPKEPSAAPEAGAERPRRGGGGLPARLFSAAPAGRGNGTGLQPWMLIAIIAVVAVVAIAILVGGYLLISGALGGGATARATTTPTRSVAVLSSPVVPTITLAPPTDTPLPPPTVEVTATAAITPTRTPAAARPTATRPAVTPTRAGPTATHTPSAPPGVYVTNVETNPAHASIGSVIGFRVTFLNTTGSAQTYVWQVLVYKCPEQCDTYKTSYGQTLRMTSSIGTGTVVVDSPQNINLGIGISCDLVAIPHYVDPTNQQVVPFPSLKNNPFYYSFNVCR